MSDNDMVERVAIAIRRNKFKRTGMLSAFDPTAISEEERGEARDAIAEMRNPTPAMIKAADDTFQPYWPEAAPFDVQWDAAITAALTPGDATC